MPGRTFRKCLFSVVSRGGARGPRASPLFWVRKEGDIGIARCGVDIFFYCGDAVNKISICGVAVISNHSVCDVCIFHDAVFGAMKLFVVLWFLVWSFSDLNLGC